MVRVLVNAYCEATDIIGIFDEDLRTHIHYTTPHPEGALHEHHGQSGGGGAVGGAGEDQGMDSRQFSSSSSSSSLSSSASTTGAAAATAAEAAAAEGAVKYGRMSKMVHSSSVNKAQGRLTTVKLLSTRLVTSYVPASVSAGDVSVPHITTAIPTLPLGLESGDGGGDESGGRGGVRVTVSMEGPVMGHTAGGGASIILCTVVLLDGWGRGVCAVCGALPLGGGGEVGGKQDKDDEEGKDDGEGDRV